VLNQKHFGIIGATKNRGNSSYISFNYYI